MKKLIIIIWGLIMKNKVYSTQRGKQFNSILKLIEMGNKELAKRELRKILNHYYYSQTNPNVKLFFSSKKCTF